MDRRLRQEGGRKTAGPRIIRGVVAANPAIPVSPLETRCARPEPRQRVGNRGIPFVSGDISLVPVGFGAGGQSHGLDDLFELRTLLEGRAARRAAEFASDEDIESLLEIVDVGETAVADALSGRGAAGPDLSALQDFHAAIARMAGNAAIRDVLEMRVWTQVRQGRDRCAPWAERLPRILVEHRDIAMAIAARDPELAEILMIRHIQTARDGLALGK